MSEPAIRVEDLGKRYRLGVREKGADTLASALLSSIVSPVARFRRVRKLSKFGEDEQDIIWALRSVSFEIQPGEVVGVIGRNGAGKTTLLRILSRITSPTTGRVTLNGRVSSLLEVGTGFHPELTGRENVYLNGTLLGMSKQEIDRKFDEIVGFAEVDKFLDTPTKRYSSGMKVRLAFAVAAHLEPEILLIDEVLAVGDVRFQRKCLAKMGDVAEAGRTVLFVSHNMAAVSRLCQRSLLLQGGSLADDGPSARVVSRYLSSDDGTTGLRTWHGTATAPGDDVVRLREVAVKTEDGAIVDSIDVSCPFRLEAVYEVVKSESVLIPAFVLSNEEGVTVFTTLDSEKSWWQKRRPKGIYRSSVRIPGHLLAEGRITVTASVSSFSPKVRRVKERDVVAFQVVDRLDSDSARQGFSGELGGVVRPLLDWSTSHLDSGSWTSGG